MTEQSTTIHTAEELLQFLLTIPEGVRARLPLMLLVNDEGGDAYEAKEGCLVEAFEVCETQGNIERGLRLSLDF